MGAKSIRALDQTLVLLNGTTIPYRQLTVPCCRECNNEHLEPIESNVMAAVNQGPEAVEALDRKTLFLWLGKIFFGLLYKESLIPLTGNGRHGGASSQRSCSIGSWPTTASSRRLGSRSASSTSSPPRFRAHEIQEPCEPPGLQYQRRIAGHDDLHPARACGALGGLTGWRRLANRLRGVPWRNTGP